MTPSDVLALRLRLPLDRFALDVELATSALVTGIFGPSGAGKTSLIECVAGLRPDAVGSIRLGDEVWLDSDAGLRLPPERRRVGLVPQDGLLFAHLDVRGNLLASRRRDGNDERRRDTLDTVVSILELEPLLARRVDTLSGGERQRVALGRAVCSAPRLLLLDEPLAALDLPLQRRILPFLRRVHEIFPIPMLFVSHDPIVVQALCDDLVVLVDGAVRSRGAPRTVLTDPAVFPLAEAEGFQNIVPCRVVAEGSGACTVRLGGDASGPELHVLPGPHRPGDATVVSIPASDVILAVEEPRGLSARNVLPGVVVSIVDVDGLRLVRAALGEGIPEIAAEVTPEACAELTLGQGRRVYLIVKTAACRLFGA